MDEERRTALRRSRHECSKCDRTRIAGQAFRPFTCEKCGQERMHPNTAIPRFCPECCTKENICRRCGGPMD